MANNAECLRCPGGTIENSPAIHCWDSEVSRSAARPVGWVSNPSALPRTGWKPILRRGLTLIELLVVVSIMMLLVVVAIPRMRPAMETRRIREAARAINVYLCSARSRAIESGRPWGVRIVRDGSMALAGLRLIQVEVPPPYAGDYDTSTIIVTPTGGPTCNVSFPMGEVPVADGLVKTGDVLKLNFQGHQWQITVSSANVWMLQSQTTANPPNTGGNGVRFQVFRQPVTSSVAPLQLPSSVVIDLWYSGTSSAWFANSATGPTSTPYPTIMFSSTGSVNQIAADTFAAQPAIEPIYLLVGRRDRVNPVPSDVLTFNYQAVTMGPLITVYEPRPVAEDRLTNFRDQTNLWVAINPQTGYIVCAEMAIAPNVTDYQGNAVKDTTNTYYLFDVVGARAFAREFQSMGGR